jgi:hypothetical protein
MEVKERNVPEFYCSLKEIAFVESPGDETLATDNVLILDEE